MAYFPLCIELSEKMVLCIGAGPQIQEKIEKLKPFGARIKVFACLSEEAREAMEEAPALVIVGDMDYSAAEEISRLCKQYHVPINVVDEPSLCTFFFPALITKGDLTVSVSTGGTSPMAAGYLRRQIEEALPDRTEEILEWLGEERSFLKEKGILKKATEQAFAENRPLTVAECEALTK